jgi:DNA-binding transcriptional regulator YiaG
MSHRKPSTTALGAQMRAFREAAGMTAAGAAARLNVNPNTLRCWESGRRCPVIGDLDRYLQVVGATITLGVRKGPGA